MSGPNGSLRPKPWWKSRREHSAPGDGGAVLVFCDRATAISQSGARLLDEVTLGLRTGSFSAVLDPTLMRSRALFLLLAGLAEPDSGRVEVKLPASSRRPGRLAAVCLIHEDSPVDPALTVDQNLLLPLASTGSFASRGQFESALSVTSLSGKASLPASELSGLDRFRLLIARAIVGGGDLILVEDPTHLRADDRRAALDLLPLLASHGSAVLLATNDPGAAAGAGRAILLRDGRLSGDFVHPGEDELREALAEGAEDPATVLGPIPSALVEAVDHSSDPAENETPAARPGSPDPADSADAASPAAAREAGSAAPAEAPARAGDGAPSPLPVLDEDSDPITRAIRILAVRDASARHARPSASGARLIRLPRSGPAPLAPTPEAEEVIDRARRILEELPGPVIPEE